MVNEAKKFEEEDKLIEKRIQAKNNFDNYLYQVVAQMKTQDAKDKVSEEDRASIKKALKRSRAWFKDSASAAELEDIEKQMKYIEGVVNPVFEKAFGNDNPLSVQENIVDDLDDL